MMSDERMLAPAWILHVRKFRDTSVILELLTAEEGRVNAVMRGVRSKRSRISGHVRPFTRVLTSWFGRGELKTIRTMDFPRAGASLTGDSLMLGMYVNELLVRVLGRYDEAPGVFAAYGELVDHLERDQDVLPTLRRFELFLLAELGYGITFELEAGSGLAIEPAGWYRFAPDEGFSRVDDVGVREDGPEPLFRGEDLLAIGAGDLDRVDTDRAAKRIVRRSLGTLLGGRGLKSRELFRRVGELT